MVHVYKIFALIRVKIDFVLISFEKELTCFIRAASSDRKKGFTIQKSSRLVS